MKYKKRRILTSEEKAEDRLFKALKEIGAL